MNGHKAAVVVILGVLGLGAMTVIEPTRNVSLDNRASAETLGPVYAPAVEQIETMELQRGQTLSALLMKASITGPDLAELLRALRTRTSPSLLNAGLEVTVRKWAHTGEARSVELRLNADTTLRLARQELGWSTDVAITPTVLDTLFVSGTIEAGKSLYESIALDEKLTLPMDERINLVGELADIYEYKVDFLHEIQPGDTYAFAYEREARPDGSSRRRRILVARLTNRGADLNAVLFNTDGIRGYYDQDGKSLRRGFRRYPMEYVRITSSFNFRRYHPVLGMYRAHLGTDFGAPTGTRVRSTGDGTVIFAGRDGGYGNVVVVRHISGYTTRYAHLSRFGAGVRSGKRVMMDDVIGYVGMTGLASGPHLHYELRLNGRAIDFSKANLPGSPPMPNKYRAEFRNLQKDRLALLQDGLSGVRYAKAKTTVSSPQVRGGI
jgi:murein DD-endopeptidase MepM/ murein hydrolase activator NlpD